MTVALGVGFVTSILGAEHRDIRFTLNYFLRVWFFLTPIIYLIDHITSKPLRIVLRLNPMTPFVAAFQDIFFFARLPSGLDVFLMTFYATASLLIGFWVFDRLRDTLAEAI